jgi:hypothetical protein
MAVPTRGKEEEFQKNSKLQLHVLDTNAGKKIS